MPQFALGRLGAVFDLGAEMRLDPDCLVRDLFGVGLAVADQRRQAFAQRRCRGLIETMVDLTGIDQVLAPVTADVDAVPLGAVDLEALAELDVGLGDQLLQVGLSHPGQPVPTM